MAGGLTEEADPGSQNLAARLVDGQQVAVKPRPPASHERPAAGTGDGQPSTKLNLNAASLADLDALPGIGPVLAQRIVDYRTEHGPFGSVEELAKVEGVSARTVEALRPLVSVEP